MTDVLERVVQLVHNLLEAGCDLIAVGTGYVINEPEHEPERSQVQEILAAFGPRMHLVTEISDYIRSLGRICDP